MRNVPPLDNNDNHRGIEEIAVEIVEDEQTLLTAVTDSFVDLWLINPTPCR